MSKTSKLRRMRKRDEAAKEVLKREQKSHEMCDRAYDLLQQVKWKHESASALESKAATYKNEMERKLNYLVEAAKHSSNHLVRFIAGVPTEVAMEARVPSVRVAIKAEPWKRQNVSYQTLDCVTVMEMIDKEMAVVRVRFGDKEVGIAVSEKAAPFLLESKMFARDLAERIYDELLKDSIQCSKSKQC